MADDHHEASNLHDSKLPVVDANTLAARSLARARVDRVFGVVGIPVTSLANRAVSLGIRFIAFHNEQSTGYAVFLTVYGLHDSKLPVVDANTLAARSLARAGVDRVFGVVGIPVTVLPTVSGPGCVHGLAGLSNAAVNAWPMVHVAKYY